MQVYDSVFLLTRLVNDAWHSRYSDSQSLCVHLQALRLLWSSLPRDVAQSVTFATIIGSRLDYCSSLYYGISNTNFQSLQRVQNAAARIVCQAPPRQHHSVDLLKDLHRLSVRSRVGYKIAVVSYLTTLAIQTVVCSEVIYVRPTVNLHRQTLLLVGSQAAPPPFATVSLHLYALLTVSLPWISIYGNPVLLLCCNSSFRSSLVWFVSVCVCVCLCVFCVFFLLMGQGPEIKWNEWMNEWIIRASSRYFYTVQRCRDMVGDSDPIKDDQHVG